MPKVAALSAAGLTVPCGLLMHRCCRPLEPDRIGEAAVWTPAGDDPAKVKEVDVMAYDSIPTQDDVKAWSQVEGGYVDGLAQLLRA